MRKLLAAVAILVLLGADKKPPVPLEKIYQLNAEWSQKLANAQKLRNELLVQEIFADWQKAMTRYQNATVTFTAEVWRVQAYLPKGFGVQVFPEGHRREMNQFTDIHGELPPSMLWINGIARSIHAITLETTDKAWARTLKQGDKFDVEAKIQFPTGDPTKWVVVLRKVKKSENRYANEKIVVE